MHRKSEIFTSGTYKPESRVSYFVSKYTDDDDFYTPTDLVPLQGSKVQRDIISIMEFQTLQSLYTELVYFPKGGQDC